MKKFSNYNEIEVNDFKPSEKIELGPHICKISDVRIEKNKGKEGKEFEVLVLVFDMTEPDKQAGFYARKFKEDADKDAMTAKWKGNFRINLPNDDGFEMDEKTKSNFKTIISSIEKSNNGYTWDWEEKSLIGKEFVGVFGIEEFESPTTGDLIYFTRCRFIRSKENMDKITIPKVKLLDKTYMDYEEWEETRKDRMKKKDNNSNESVNNVDDQEDDLPF